MTSSEIRQSFLDFFRGKDHTIVPSAPVFPQDDPTLLFTNAGMNQFKDVFLGQGSRPYRRAADTQKCIRVSGKHNDLEEVGYDTYHHTLFEMLGNWSFGDYYKAEAIQWAWELMTDVWSLPKDRLWATVHHSDNEARDLWLESTDIVPEHVLIFGDKDNFWEMGEVGPCGPCSEIHIDLSPSGCSPDAINAGRPDVIELWNLVFIQYDRQRDGSVQELPAKHVDTGMGMERITAVIQGKDSNYDTDIFSPLLDGLSGLCGRPYEGEWQTPMRVIVDHVRALSFAIADGALPSNAGRGYVLRRLLRRAARYGRKLGLEQPFIYQIVPILAESMGPFFPEIEERLEHIQRVIRSEEEGFGRTLHRGIELFDSVASGLKEEEATTFPGEDAFKLYDTYGFPVDLTELMAKEVGLEVDSERFEALMNEQRQRARLATKSKLAAGDTEQWQVIRDENHSVFLGYESLKETARVCQVRQQGDSYQVVLDRTPFYAESGGQLGDRGTFDFGESSSQVLGTFKEGDRIVHLVDALPEDLSGEVEAEVNRELRVSTARNHTATHLLHAALHRVVGEHARQAGSLVAPDRLRFDFTHYEAVNRDQLHQIEQQVNEAIAENFAVETTITSFEEARGKGAMALFGEKYGDQVRMVVIGDISRELCGGTHLASTGQTGYFRIISEGSIASGVRRIEAVTGHAGLAAVQEEHALLEQLHHLFPSVKPADLVTQVEAVLEERKALDRELKKMRTEEAASGVGALVESAREMDGFRVVASQVEASSPDEMKSMADSLRAELGTGVGVIGSIIDGKVSMVAVVTEDLIKEKRLQAGKIIGEVARIVGGGGGGRPHLAQAGGKNPEKLGEALESVPGTIQRMLAPPA